jgi:type III restriction enzyme
LINRKNQFKASKLINEQKAALTIEKITYNKIEGTFEKEIATNSSIRGELGKDAIETEKHIYDYLIMDSNVEREFAMEPEAHNEVMVYAKLPKGFYINTPVGNYNPDWALVFDKEQVKYVYFIAETKGSLDSLELRKIEKAKIKCAQKHF